MSQFKAMFRDIWIFLWKRKQWWLVPILLVLLLVGGLLIFAGNTAVAPFIYSIF